MLRTLRITLAAIALSAGLAVTAARAEEPKVPETAAEHLAMSRSYQEKAAAWWAEAGSHQDMLATYRKTHPDRKSGARNSWAARMEEHCGALIEDARRLAADAETLATFHRLRALELEGK